MQLERLLTKAVIAMTIALTLVSCGTSAPASVAGLRRVIGVDLIGAKGATPLDQRKIDRTIVGSCAADIYTRDECAAHGRLTQE